MSTATDVEAIKNRVGAKRVLLVEGTDDVPLVTRCLESTLGASGSPWTVEKADNKKKVLALLRHESSWRGVVDRDEWDDDRVADESSKLPNLMVLPRFTVENYLIVPAEIWPTLPPAHQSLLGGYDAFHRAIVAELPRWVRHGVLWKTIAPLWEGLRSRGFKDALAGPGSFELSQDDGRIRQILDQWQDLLSPEAILQRFQTALSRAQAQPVETQLKTFVHGKLFWESVVYPAINRAPRPISHKDLRHRTIRNHPGFDDLGSLLRSKLT